MWEGLGRTCLNAQKWAHGRTEVHRNRWIGHAARPCCHGGRERTGRRTTGRGTRHQSDKMGHLGGATANRLTNAQLREPKMCICHSFGHCGPPNAFECSNSQKLLLVLPRLADVRMDIGVSERREKCFWCHHGPQNDMQIFGRRQGAYVKILPIWKVLGRTRLNAQKWAVGRVEMHRHRWIGHTARPCCH